LDHDRADLNNNHKISIPALRVLWGAKGMIAKYGDVIAEWKKVCHEGLVEVTGRHMECGHYIAEESSEELLREILEFFSEDYGN
jgi:haloacetate dehalogenase